MSWFQSFAVAVLTGIVGLFSAGLVAAMYSQWYNVSNREGAAGFMMVGVAILGGFAGGVLGLVIARAMAGAGFWKVAGCSPGLVIGVAGVLTFVFYIFADIPPKLNGDEMRLEVEIKLPVGHARPAGDARFTLGSVINHRQRASQPGDLWLDRARIENDRWIVPADVYLFTTRGYRFIMAEVDGTNLASFMVPLPARPTSAHAQWSEWGPQPRAGSPPWPNTKPSYRFRVQRIARATPAPTQEEIQAKDEAEAQAKFDAIPPDAPISVYIPYAQPFANEKRSVLALERITTRPGWINELGALMLDADPRQAEEAFLLVTELPKPSAELFPMVSAAARDIVARMHKFNSTPPEDDPGMDGANDVSIRFSAWKEAVRALRTKASGDFTGDLHEILELSRVRTDSQVMQLNVRRVASYYLKTWAGVEPLPGDPPP